MSIGLIIFIISIVISLITAINDKSHKKRQNQQPRTKQPRQQPSAERKEKKSIFEQLGETFEELQREFDDSSKKSSNEKPSSTNQPRRNESGNVNRRDDRTTNQVEENRTQPRNVSQKDLEAIEELNNSLNNELTSYRSDIDREKEKQLAIIERRAQKIINDKYLSNRAKQARLKQLFSDKTMLGNRQNQNLRFDDDEILNGIIWSEILKKPKQLQ
ncbi:hypothetical protein CD149_06485 [Staphylococcus condimenti]|uniref:Staphylococcal protein n=1 Tax=Staphylococcus condimenti TaxID=70255 RepID=A0AB37H1R1_9STAP|nr:hypothetical protein [Staphylococcus condimenti]AMY04664.1 hypothetical protein A4G25_01495 [Staphylococcus condimenti]PNZ60838.1 hypothetical protein CD149_06485 [Staphylococcus condimenti]QQS83532.1 hypothetical protein I6J05_04220 [Staphylococcus condimenti]QRP96419.1 hypothetical protein I6J35_04810 [Staphylococcus condimenti]VEG64221.1 putative staphylococcal protein [Staphylococcus condimenti]